MYSIKRFFCIWSILAILLCPKSVFAQKKEIKGQVLDLQTGLPVEGVLIASATNESESTLSNENGMFAIKTESKTLLVSHVSYLEEVVSVSDKFLNIEIEQHEDVLNQVAVTGNRSTKKIVRSTVSLERVPPKLIEDKNPFSLDEIVNQVPGVVVTDQQISIRGGAGWSYGAGSRVMVLMDGMPLASGDAGQVLWTFINLENVKSMEVIKGASSVLYGSSALNGIISIESNWAKATPKTGINLYGGTYSKGPKKGLQWSNSTLGTFGIRAYHARQIKKMDVIASVDYLNDDGYRFNDFDRRLNSGISFRYKFSDNVIAGFRSNTMVSESGSFLLWNSLDSGYSALNNASTVNDVLRFKIDPFLTIYTENKGIHKIKSRYLRVVNKVDNGDTSVDQSNSSHIYFGEYVWQKIIAKNLTWTAGATASKTITESPLFGGNQEAQNLAGFFQLDRNGEKLGVNLGFRLENYQLNDYKETKPVLRFGLNYKLKKYSFIRASWGQGYRFPTIAESYISTNVGLLNIFPNEELQSETGWNAEIGLKQGIEVLGVKALLDFSIYRMQYNNMMEFIFSQWRPDFFNGIGFKSVNMGAVRVDGFEISTTGTYKKRLQSVQFLVGYNYNIPTALEPGKVVDFDSSRFFNPITYSNTSSDTSNDLLKYRNQHIIKADFTYKYKRFTFGVSQRYLSAIQNHDLGFLEGPITLELTGIKEGIDLVGSGTYQLDVRAFYKVNRWLRAGIVVNNLSNTVEMSRPADLNAPRNWVLQLKGEF